MTGARWADAIATSLLVAVGLAAGYFITFAEIPLREFATLGYLLVAPGLAVVWIARVKDRAMQLSLIVPVSVTVDALVATALIYAGIWSPTLALVLVAAVTLAIVLMGAREGSARAALVALTLLPPTVLLTGQL